MTNIHLYASPSKPLRRAHSDTIYRDTPLSPPAKTASCPARCAFAPVPLDERTSTGILLGLGAMLLPTVAYSFVQMCSLISGGSLERAVQAFLR